MGVGVGVGLLQAGDTRLHALDGVLEVLLGVLELALGEGLLAVLQVVVGGAQGGAGITRHPLTGGLAQGAEGVAIAARERVLDTVRKSLAFELRTTAEVANPFGYARQFVQSKDGSRRTTFFYPHDAETAPWWQGENARIASLATAARMAAKYFPEAPGFTQALQTYAWNQLNWILGENPYDCCMLQGTGRNNPFYMFFDSYEYHNAPGGIVN